MKIDRKGLWIAAALSIAAFTVRIFDLTGRSMWLDEGYTLVRIVGSWQSILVNVMLNQGLPYVDSHPPLYFLILKAWGLLGGTDEFALKLFSVFCGVLIVPLTYVLARRMFSHATGVVAAVLALSSPAYQWYSHELRMYPLVFCLAALSTYGFYRWAQALPRPAGRANRWWIVWLAVTAVSLATHYTLVSLTLFQGFGGILVLLHRKPVLKWRRPLILGLIAAMLLGLAITYAALQNGIFGIPAITPLPDLLRAVLDGSLFGLNATDPTNSVITWLFGAVCVLGFVLPLKQPDARTGARPSARNSFWARSLLMASAFGVIVLIDIALTVTRHWIDLRYFVMVIPAMHVLFARAATLVWGRMTGAGAHKTLARTMQAGRKVVAGLAVTTVIAAQLFGLWWGGVRTPFWQDDWRGMAAYIRDNYQSGDALLMGIYTPDEVLKLYLRDVPIDYHYATEFLSMPTDEASLALGKGHKRIWYAETGRAGSTRLDASLARYFKHARLPVNSHTDILDLMLYEVESPVTTSIPATATPIKYADTANSQRPHVAAYEIKPGNRYNPLPNMWLSLYWQGPMTTDGSTYNVAARLKSADNTSWADWFMPARLDIVPSTWEGNQLFRVDYLVPIPDGLPLQAYTMQLDISLGEKAEVNQSVALPLTQDEVSCCVRLPAWPGIALPQNSPVQWQTNGAALVKTEYRTVLQPGALAPVIVTWKLDRPFKTGWQTTLSLEKLTGGVVVSMTTPATAGQLPIAAWPVNELMRTVHVLELPYTVKPGYYRLTLARKEDSGRVMDGVLLGLVEVRDYPPSPIEQNVPNRINGNAGTFTLLGYALEQPFARDVTLPFHVYWRIDSATTDDGVLFLHLFKPDGTLAAQDDNPPEQGKRSTLTYRAGSGIDQVHRLVIPKDAPAGVYKMYAGIYNRGDKERWTSVQDGKNMPDKQLYLGELVLP